MGNNVTCLACGWVHFPVSRAYAEAQVEQFGFYYNTLTPEEQQERYGGKPSMIEDYLHCFRCSGSYKNFRDSLPTDCRDGCTVQPILKRDE